MVTDPDLLDVLCRLVTGRPAGDLDWRELLRVRDQVHAVLNGAVNTAQNPASTSPDRRTLERDATGTKVASAYPFPRIDLPAPDVGGGALGAGPRPCSRSVADHQPDHPHTPTTTKENDR